MTGPDPEDEFRFLPGNAAEAGVPVDAVPTVRRTTTSTPSGRVSMLRWGSEPPRLVLLHGGGQNSHTWDTVLAALGLPAVAVDLPGHGHSDWREDRDYSPGTTADTVAAALAAESVQALPVVGMSMGGLTSIALAARHPEAVSRLVVVDVTPSVMGRVEAMTTAQRGTTALVGGPETFDDLETMVAAATAAAPRRPPGSVRRGVVHNSRQLPGGRWAWRYDRPRDMSPGAFDRLWDDVAATPVPVTLIRGGDSAFVGDDDVAEFRRRRPDVTVEVVEGAGHSVQSDRPRQLASLLRTALDLG